MSDETSGSSPELPVATSADAEAPAAANETSAAGSVNDAAAAVAGASEWRCTCGRPSTRWPGEYCDAHHPIPGTPGPAVTNGLEAEHLPETADVQPGAYADLLDRHITRLSNFIDSHPPRLKDLPDIERLWSLAEKVNAFKERERRTVASTASTDTDGEELPGDWPTRLARHFAEQPDQFGEFIQLLLAADRDRCGPLRSQTRLTLDHLEPQGVPKFRGRRDAHADPDTVIL